MRHNMTVLSETYLNYAPVPIENLIGKKGKNQKSMIDIPAEELIDYAAEDADITLRLYHYLKDRLDKEKLNKIYEYFEKPMIKILSKIRIINKQ